MKSLTHRRGYTLVELLITIGLCIMAVGAIAGVGALIHFAIKFW